MALHLEQSSAARIIWDVPSTIPAGTPATIAGWVEIDVGVTGFVSLMVNLSSSVGIGYSFSPFAFVNNANDIDIICFPGSGTSGPTFTWLNVGVSTGERFHLMMAHDSSIQRNSQLMWLNGVPFGISDTASGFGAGSVNVVDTTITMGVNAALTTLADSTFADVGVWTKELGDGEAVTLAAGFEPKSVAPENLWFAPTLIRSAADYNYSGEVPTTETGTTPVDHPFIIRVPGQQVFTIGGFVPPTLPNPRGRFGRADQRAGTRAMQ